MKNIIRLVATLAVLSVSSSIYASNEHKEEAKACTHCKDGSCDHCKAEKAKHDKEHKK